MQQFTKWIAMGGYYWYIWPAYALVASVLIINALGLRRNRRVTQKRLQIWQQDNKTFSAVKQADESGS